MSARPNWCRSTNWSSEEREILEAFEKGTLKLSNDAASSRKWRQECAAAVFNMDERINIRISFRDLRELQKRALEEGIPDQTPTASILRKYVEGRLSESDG